LDLKLQLHKIGRVHSSGIMPPEGISPSGLKRVVGNFSPVFSGPGQQDSVEFLYTLLDLIKKEYHDNELIDINKLFYYDNESRLFFEQKYVSYSYSRNLVFNIPVMRDFITNQKAVLEYEEKLNNEQNDSKLDLALSNQNQEDKTSNDKNIQDEDIIDEEIKKRKKILKKSRKKKRLLKR